MDRRREQCRTFPERGDCLLGAEHRADWNCAVCRAIETWASERRPVVLVREIQNRTGLYVVPGSSDTPDLKGFLMQARLAGASTTDLRALLQTILASSEQTWIAETSRSIRVK